MSSEIFVPKFVPSPSRGTMVWDNHFLGQIWDKLGQVAIFLNETGTLSCPKFGTTCPRQLQMYPCPTLPKP